MPVLNLTPKEVQTLKGVLLVEKQELEGLIANEENARDKKGLSEELKRVESMLLKIS